MKLYPLHKDSYPMGQEGSDSACEWTAMLISGALQTTHLEMKGSMASLETGIIGCWTSPASQYVKSFRDAY